MSINLMYSALLIYMQDVLFSLWHLKLVSWTKRCLQCIEIAIEFIENRNTQRYQAFQLRLTMDLAISKGELST